tara:strand:- start:2402 stop:3028 length:627 start_codon:yes stop_codon:yes gene_type:complete
MQIPKNFFLVEVEKPYEDTVEINGVEIEINITYNPLVLARQYGVVYETPGFLPKGLEFDVKKGDKIYFHHLITASSSNASNKEITDEDYKSDHLVEWIGKKNIYKVHWQHIYARVRKGKLKMLHHWNFVKQKTETDDDIKTKSGIYLKSEKEDITLHGYIEHLSDWMKEQGIKKGDEVVFSENSEYNMKIEGKTLMRMRNADILAKVE